MVEYRTNKFKKATERPPFAVHKLFFIKETVAIFALNHCSRGDCLLARKREFYAALGASVALHLADNGENALRTLGLVLCKYGGVD